jgi:formate dehydrogenase iron-sulfur subunit
MANLDSGTEMALLFDVTHCIGCGACYEACKERNELPETSDDFLDDELSANTFTILQPHEGDRYSRRLCMHCQSPTCVSVCPVGALEKTALGPVIYHGERCIGCRYCMQACPFNIPKYEWDALWPLIRKCDMCASRVAEGNVTACTEACPADATVFGTREEMIALARSRIAENPDGYINHIYGLEEIGGTSVLFISDIPFEALGLPTNLGTQPLPELTWAVLEKIPRFSVLASVLLGGIWWITRRREEVAKAEGKGAHS